MKRRDKQRGYDEGHLHKNKVVKLVGVDFRGKEKSVGDWSEEVV